MSLRKKNIWIINQYASTPETGIGGRHYYLARELAKAGYKVYLIAGSYSHLLRNIKEFNGNYIVENISPNFDFIWIKLKKYQNAHSKKRIYNEFLFSWQISKLKSWLGEKPDFIYHSSPALISFFGARFLSNHFNATYIFEERDIWPLTLIELGGYSKYHPFVIFLQWIQDQAYKKSNFIFSNLPNAFKSIEYRGADKKKFFWIPNGVSLDEVFNTQSISDSIRCQIPTNKFIVGYTGTIGEANAIHSLIQAAILLRNEQNIYFILIGNGKDKNDLQKICNNEKLENILFLDSIPKNQIQSMLSYFDICFVGSKNSNLYQFGASPNKLAEYLYAKKPVVYSIPDENNIVEQAQAGISTAAEDPRQIADAIKDLYHMPKIKRIEMGENGKNFVLENLDYKKISFKISDIINNTNK